jgi:hypothetical protein
VALVNVIGKVLFAIAFFVPVLIAWLSRRVGPLLRGVVTLAFILLALRLFARVNVYFIDWLLYAAALIIWVRDRGRLRLAALVVVLCLGVGWLGLYACLKSPGIGGLTTLVVGALDIDSLGPFVVPWLEHTRTYDSDFAAWALGRLGDPRYIPPLLDLLDKGGFEEGESAAYALIAIGDERAVPGLIEIATDPARSTMAKWYARYAIARITEADELRDFRRELATSWADNESGGSEYTETEQIELFRQWWQQNRSRYPDRVTASFVPFSSEVTERSRSAFAWVIRLTALLALAPAAAGFRRGRIVPLFRRRRAPAPDDARPFRVRLMVGSAFLALAVMLWLVARSLDGHMMPGFAAFFVAYGAGYFASMQAARIAESPDAPRLAGNFYMTKREAVSFILLLCGLAAGLGFGGRASVEDTKLLIAAPILFVVPTCGSLIVALFVWARKRSRPRPRGTEPHAPREVD